MKRQNRGTILNNSDSSNIYLIALNLTLKHHEIMRRKLTRQVIKKRHKLEISIWRNAWPN